MTKELAIKLRDWYVDSVKMCEGLDRNGTSEMIIKRKVQHGLCYCSDHVFKSCVYDDKWVKSFGYYMCKTAWQHRSIDGMLSALQFRIDRLNEFIADNP